MGYSEVGLSHWDSLTQEEIKCYEVNETFSGQGYVQV